MGGSRESTHSGENPFTAELTEFCSSCRAETSHVATIRIQTENPDRNPGETTRQPYRISGCAECGETTERRAMNL
jgi:hypothetical protein